MTAEVAILNKTAVALATDSAVTISSGNQAVKIFESADKLFELSVDQPIGIMIYNGMQFLGMPIEAVIKAFRKERRKFATVKLAADAFLAHLYKYVDEAPDVEIVNSIRAIVDPIALEISERIKSRVFEVIDNADRLVPKESNLEEAIRLVQTEVLDEYKRRVASLPKVDLIPDGSSKRSAKRYSEWVKTAVREALSGVPETVVERIVPICRSVLKSDFISNARTGLVIAGFGEDERFPTLISFEIDGLNDGKIRYRQTDHCDIDRRGPRAYVRPFAQKDMVDRFLYGLDDRLRADITSYCRETIGRISHGIFDSITIEDVEERQKLLDVAKKAEEAFTNGLNDEAFAAFQHRSRREIEDMVEFMPKPELAKMAEALIDLTSIKRKVSQGMETVGGPVDVAVISKNDGFVWIKRKHYFPADINSRYFERNIRTAQTVEAEKGMN